MSPAMRLRELRRRAGITSAKKAANFLKVPRETYYKHETGKRGLSPEAAARYAKFFDVPAAMILFGDEHALVFPAATPEHGVRLLGSVNDQGVVEPLELRWLEDTGLSVREALDAVIVETDALEPAFFRGDVVVFSPLMRPLNPKLVAGRQVVLATVRTDTTPAGRSRMMLAKLHRQVGKVSDRNWEVIVGNEPPVQRRVALASPVRWIKRLDVKGPARTQ